MVGGARKELGKGGQGSPLEANLRRRTLSAGVAAEGGAWPGSPRLATSSSAFLSHRDFATSSNSLIEREGCMDSVPACGSVNLSSWEGNWRGLDNSWEGQDISGLMWHWGQFGRMTHSWKLDGLGNSWDEGSDSLMARLRFISRSVIRDRWRQ